MVVLVVLGWIGRVAAAVLFAVAVLALVLRFVDVTRPWQAALVALVPVLTVASMAATILLLLFRARGESLVGAAVVVALLVPGLAVLVERGPAASAAAGPALTVMSSNLLFGEADPRAVVAAVRERKVDVLCLQELTVSEVRRLRKAGLDKVLPHSRVSAVDDGAAGVGLWSRYRLAGSPALPALRNHVVGARLLLPGGGTGPTVLSVHPSAPYPTDTAAWNEDLVTLRGWLAGQAEPLIVAGDYNATRDHARFRALLSAGAGYADAATEAGSFLPRTWPARRPDLPLFGLDHVLLGHGPTATSFRTLSIAGTDHRAIVTELRLGG